MLVVFGGFIGTGKRHFARRVATHLGGHYFDVHLRKPRFPGFNKLGDVEVRQPRTDDMWINLYRGILEEFRVLSIQHAHVIIDDDFHRKIPREIFLEGARTIFPRVVFIWFQADQESIETRLINLSNEGRGDLSHVRRRLKRTRKTYEPVDEQVPLFDCSISRKGKFKELISLIQFEAAHPRVAGQKKEAPDQ